MIFTDSKTKVKLKLVKFNLLMKLLNLEKTYHIYKRNYIYKNFKKIK